MPFAFSFPHFLCCIGCRIENPKGDEPTSKLLTQTVFDLRDAPQTNYLIGLEFLLVPIKYGDRVAVVAHLPKGLVLWHRAMSSCVRAVFCVLRLIVHSFASLPGR
jgi:hypothetical protein